MKFDPEHDFEFFTSYATTWLNNHLPFEMSFVLITALPAKPIKIRSNTDGEDTRELLHLGFKSTSDFLEATINDGVEP